MSKSPVETWLWLLLVMQPCNPKAAFILSRCDYDAQAACRQIRDGKLPFLNENEKRRAAEVRMGAVRELQKTCAENNVRIIAFDDPEYPEMLRTIDNPPIVLFVAGSLAGLTDKLMISAVGAREVSEYGARVTDHICYSLTKMGAVIVSGLAVGSDAAAHRACLNADGRTIGVLGCGIMVNYPKQNAQLKRDIVAGGGAVISELLPNSKPFGGYFSVRNRIIAGLSHGTLVLEASEKSGSLLTVSHALQQGREVFCIPPHDILSARYAGQSALLRDGAIPVFNYTDIVDNFSLNFSTHMKIEGVISQNAQAPVTYKEPSAPRVSDKSEDEENGSENSPEKSSEKTPQDGLEEKKPQTDESVLSSLSENEAAVLKLLFGGASDADSLVDKTGLEFGELSEILTSLEIYGYITLNSEGFYTIQ